MTQLGYKADSIRFSGHLRHDKTDNKNIASRTLIHETAFFRGVSTLEFIKNHLSKTLTPDNPLRMANFGCSTGEETYTLAMLFNDHPNSLQITGYDLGEKAIQSAQKGHFPIEPLGGRQFYDAYKDNYLAFSDHKLSSKQKEYRTLFNSFFKTNSNLYESVKELLLSCLKERPIKTKYFQLKDDSLKKHCQFKQGDIMEIDRILEPDSTEIVLFRNALYHLITKENLGRRYPKRIVKTRPVLNEFFSKIHTALSENGLFVLGENENHQTTRLGQLIHEELENAGFKPIHFIDGEVPSVWQKI